MSAIFNHWVGKEKAAHRQRDRLRRKEIGMIAKCKRAEGSGGTEATQEPELGGMCLEL